MQWPNPLAVLGYFTPSLVITGWLSFTKMYLYIIIIIIITIISIVVYSVIEITISGITHVCRTEKSYRDLPI